MATAVLWFRRDLRLDDSGALSVAASYERVIPLFVVDPSLLDRAGPNRRRFLADALRALDQLLGGTLVLRRGDPTQVVPAVADEVAAATVVATADFGPYGRTRDRAVEAALGAARRALSLVDSPYAVAPGTVRGRSGRPLQVFGPFRRTWEATGWEPVSSARVTSFGGAPSDVSVDLIESGPARAERRGLPEWWEGLPLDSAAELPPAGPAEALGRLDRFVSRALPEYAEKRDFPALAGSSGLSPYLRFGCIHPRTVLARLGAGPGADRMRAELAWREFYADVVWHQPDSARQPLQSFGRHLVWDSDLPAQERFRAWATGRTGYPLVDAGMRQLLAEGWMHNRLRMVTASFLVKDLHIDWRLGARWFMWQLVDGDLASNQHGWQWVAGTGTDAAPFHRVLNPLLQQARFDPDGSYVRRYLNPSPSAGDRGLDGSAGSLDYPSPLVDHLQERREALTRFAMARRAAAAAPLDS